MDFPGVQSGSHFEAEWSYGFSDRQRTSDGPGGGVESRQESVTRGLYFDPTESFQLGTNCVVMGVQEVPPALISEGTGKGGGVHDIGEEKGG
jgi:hypothetical protein